jgi:hypothetical protein
VLAAPDDVSLPAHLAARDPERPARTPWVVYLPGVHRHELTDLTQLPDHLAPLADIALRSSWWLPPGGQSPWTPHSFLGSKYGARLDLAGDAATRQALAQVLPRLLVESADVLRNQGRLDAARLHARAMPDAIRTLLSWIDDPVTTREHLSEAEWASFAHTCQATYKLNLSKDTPITAAVQLGAREGEWATVWQRFAEVAHRYPGIHTALDQARPPATLLGDGGAHPDSWPSWNREQEDSLRSALMALVDLPSAAVARLRLAELADEHAPRRGSVWAELDQAPLADAVVRLRDLVEAAADVSGNSPAEAVAWYADRGYVADRVAVEVRAGVIRNADRDAVLAALHVLYDPWVDRTARTFQSLVQSGGYAGVTGLSVEPGTCVVYVDALRLDLAHRLVEKLAPRTAAVDHRLAAFPSLTPTGQPAVAPVEEAARASWGAGPDFDAGDAEGRSLKGQVLRKALADAGVEFLEWESGDTGDPAGIAWTQSNDIDSAGHATKGARLESVVDGLLNRVAHKIDTLLSAGWRRAVIVTDHGFLLPARAAHKAELPLAVTQGGGTRKPRVARLRDGAPTQAFPTVPWAWDPAVLMVSAPGSAAFEDGVTYEHGGLSLQECVIPVVTVTDGVESQVKRQIAAQIAGVRWSKQRCRIDVIPTDAPVTVVLRTAPGDPASAVAGPKAVNEDGEAKLLVSEEDAPEGTQVHVVLLAGDRVIAQQLTTVGGDQ